MYQVIENKTTKQSIITDELTDFLFEEGWRYVGEVPNYVVNIFEVDEENRQSNIRQFGF
jgi:hypothetical protein